MQTVPRPFPRRVAAAILACLLPWAAAACSTEPANTESSSGRAAAAPDMNKETPVSDTNSPAGDAASRTEIATLGAGCFWCVEAVLEQVPGVVEVHSGYMGGHVENPTYRAVCTGETGHAEVVQVTFDPAKLPYEHLLEWFWKLHDPTTLNRQGADVGTQYRSAIFYHSDAQRTAAEASRSRKDVSGEFADPIVTEITPATKFYEAEDYHQDYYRQNRSQGYCRAVIAPKLDKLGLEK